MIKRWVLNELTEEQKARQEKLTLHTNYSPVLIKMLAQRGIETAEQAAIFFNPSLDKLHDPFLMKDMDKAVERLTEAVYNKEKILVYGDYDVDGTTSVILVYNFLKEIHPYIDFYIPNRYNEGYGISLQGINYAAERGVGLVIALDCGIKDVAQVALAQERGIDFIICDHHTAGNELPPAVAVLDPKREDCEYPFPELSGCGVGFKFMQAFAQQHGMGNDKLFNLLELVVLSIASDIVPIVDENRILAHYGLKQINDKSKRSIALGSLLKVCGISDQEISISDIVFKIGPRINASGRMNSAEEVVRLFTSNDPSFTDSKSEEINDFNNKRKELDKTITDSALSHIESDEVYKDRRSIVVYNPTWHKGVIGIVASRLTEKYHKPTIVLTKSSNGFVSGSARSVAGFNIYDAINSCHDLLETFGGHLFAAGLSLHEENLESFIERFEHFVNTHILPEQMHPKIHIDSMLDFRELLETDFHNTLKAFAPFGPGNMKPVFATKQVMDRGSSRTVGRENEHLKMSIGDSSSNRGVNGIAFKLGEQYCRPLKDRLPLDICYTLEENTFNGVTSMQLMVKDIKLQDDNHFVKVTP